MTIFRQTQWVITSICLMFVCLWSLTSWAKDSSPSDTPHAQNLELYLNWQHQFEYAGYYAALHKGYYRDAGLNVTIKPYKMGLSPREAVLEQTGRYGVSDNRVILDYLRSKPLVLLANIFKVSPHIIITQPDIQTPSQLKGARIMSVPQELESAGMLTMLRQFYVTSEDYQRVPYEDAIDKFAHGEIDAMTAYRSNQPYELEKRGIPFNVLDPTRYAGELYAGNLITSEAEVTQHPERAQQFLDATLMGWQYALDHPEELIELIHKNYNPDRSVEALTYEADRLREAIKPTVHPIGSIDKERLRQIASIYIEYDYDVTRTQIEGLLLMPDQARLASIGLSVEEQAFLQMHPVLNVHNETNWPPINFVENGNPTGFSVDFMNQLAQKLGIRVNYVTGNDFPAFMDMLEDRDLDVMLNIVETPERAKHFLFTEPYLAASSGIYTKSGSDLKIKSLDDLVGHSVAVPTGFFLNEQLKRYFPNIEIKNYPDSVKALEAVASGEADAIIGRTGVLNYLIDKHLLTNVSLTSSLEDPRFTSQMQMAVHKADPVLRDILNKAMGRMTESELAALRRKWGQNANAESSLTLEEQEYLNQREPIRLCVDPNWMPFEGLDEQEDYVGMASDYFTLFERFLHIPFEVVPTKSWPESLESAKQRHCDVVSIVMKTRETSTFLNFTTPFMNYPYVVATRQEELFIESLDQILEERIAIVEDYALLERFKKEYPDTEWVPVKSIEDGLLKVQSGAVFGLIDSVPSIGYAIRELGLTDIRITGKLDEERPLRTGVRNDDPLLFSVIQKAVDHLDQDDHQDIRRRWAPVEVEREEDYTLALAVFAASILAISFLVYRQFTLKRYNDRIRQAYQEKDEIYKALVEKNRLLEQISTTDPLTQVYNRLKMNSILHTEIQRVKRYGGLFSVLMLDLDHFKKVNDTYGHPVGDEVLLQFVDKVRECLRSTDSLGRWGGEEFIIMCPETNLRSALLVADNLRRQIESAAFDTIGRQTVSIGVTAYQPGDTQETIVARADQALYFAKENGRNKVSSEPRLS
jgi:two-component system sensor histidine kinase EvgS